MGLRRYTSEDPHGGTFDGHPTEYYRAADVDALLARIRAAVAVERVTDPAVNHRCDCPFGWCDGRCPTLTSRAALDALLADGGA